MPVIFISYRRSDSQDVTGRIYDRLISKFTHQQVFKDVDNIPLGVSFSMHIRQMLAKANIALVIIGPNWANVVDEDGRRRLDDPNDYVRVEVETALNANMPVIPVLVSNARIPRADDLPPSMQKLVSRNCIAVRPDPDFNHDIARLFSGIVELERLKNSGETFRIKTEMLLEPHQLATGAPPTAASLPRLGQPGVPAGAGDEKRSAARKLAPRVALGCGAVSILGCLLGILGTCIFMSLPSKTKTTEPQVASARIIGDWEFKKDFVDVPVKDGRLVGEHDKDAMLADDSGQKNFGRIHFGKNGNGPVYQEYVIPPNWKSANLDRFALRTGPKHGYLFFADRPALQTNENFSVWFRVQILARTAEGRQAMVARPWAWTIFMREDGKLEANFSSTGGSISDVFKGDGPDLTDHLGTWMDIGFSFQGRGGDTEDDVVKVYFNGNCVDSFKGRADFGRQDWLHIGSDGGGSPADALFDRVIFFDGVLDEAGFRKLSPVQLPPNEDPAKLWQKRKKT